MNNKSCFKPVFPELSLCSALYPVCMFTDPVSQLFCEVERLPFSLHLRKLRLRKMRRFGQETECDGTPEAAVIDLSLPEDSETAGEAEGMLPAMWKRPLVLQL